MRIGAIDLPFRKFHLWTVLRSSVGELTIQSFLFQLPVLYQSAVSAVISNVVYIDVTLATEYDHYKGVCVGIFLFT